MLTANHQNAYLKLSGRGFYNANSQARAFEGRQPWKTTDLGKSVLFSLLRSNAQEEPTDVKQWILVEDINWEDGNLCSDEEAWSQYRRDHLRSLDCADLGAAMSQAFTLTSDAHATIRISSLIADPNIDGEIIEELRQRSRQIDILITQSSYDAVDRLYYGCLRLAVPEQWYLAFIETARIQDIRRKFLVFDIEGAKKLYAEACGHVSSDVFARIEREAVSSYKCTIRSRLFAFDFDLALSTYKRVSDLLPGFNYNSRELRARALHAIIQHRELMPAHLKAIRKSVSDALLVDSESDFTVAFDVCVSAKFPDWPGLTELGGILLSHCAAFRTRYRRSKFHLVAVQRPGTRVGSGAAARPARRSAITPAR